MATIWESQLPFELQRDGRKKAKYGYESVYGKSERRMYGPQWEQLQTDLPGLSDH